MKYRLLAFSFASVLSFSAQTSVEHKFDFKGYNLQLNSMATDETGQFLFCGSIESVESVPMEEKDTVIWNRMNKNGEGLFNRERQGIIIQTDQSFAIQQIYLLPGFFLSNALYDKECRSFWIGASFLNFPGKSGLTWQMVLINFDPVEKSYSTSFIETDYSCRMRELLLVNQTLTCIALKEVGENEDEREAPVVIEVSGTKFHKNADIPYLKSPEIIKSVISPAETANHVYLTEAVTDKTGFYFAANRFPFGQIPTLGIDIYRYENGKLSFKPFVPSQETNDIHHVTNVQLTQDGNLLLVYNPKYDGKYFVMEKLTSKMGLLWTVIVPDLQYPDFQNELLVLPNGKIVVAGMNAEKTWSYFIYSADGKLEKEINTQMPEELSISFTKAINGSDFVCLFYSHSDPVANTLLIYSSN